MKRRSAAPVLSERLKGIEQNPRHQFGGLRLYFSEQDQSTKAQLSGPSRHIRKPGGTAGYARQMLAKSVPGGRGVAGGGLFEGPVCTPDQVLQQLALDAESGPGE